MFSTAFTYMASTTAAPSFSFLLDDYPNAASAYSLRLLRSAYTGNCIEVRRSSDNTTQNIGFVNNELDTSSLLSFVGAGEGYIRTWYDQSGSGVNATQTTNSEQPRIVNGGVVETEGGKNSIRFTTTAPGTSMQFNPNVSQPNSVFIVYQSDGIATGHIYDSQSRQLIGYTPGYVTYAGSAIVSYPTIPTTFGLVSAIFDGANSVFQFNNGVDQTGNPGTAPFDSSLMFKGQGGSSATGYVSEFIVYSGDKSSSKAGIKTNINDYYSLY